MTKPTTLTPKEALMALSAGRKLTKPDWPKKLYISLSDIGSIVNQDGCYAIFGGDYLLYTEPKPKRKLAPYYVEYDNGSFVLEVKCFETDEQAKKYFETESVTRCTALEIEV